VDDYDMTNGEPAFLDVPNQIINPASGYDPTNPYANRDPRLAATIIYNGASIGEIGDHPAAPPGSVYEAWQSADGEVWGLDSPKHNPDNTASAMALRKFMPQDGVLISRQLRYTNPWPMFRLGEIYLNYAEAQLELGNEAVAREYISKVRARPSVDLPPIPASVTGEALRERLINERRIELAFEGHRFFDIRRCAARRRGACASRRASSRRQAPLLEVRVPASRATPAAVPAQSSKPIGVSSLALRSVTPMPTVALLADGGAGTSDRASDRKRSSAIHR
jgi:hypothetical protein